jgi:rubrerythrin
MCDGCAGAPNAGLFQRLLADESRHLQSLEDLYEQHFLTEN